MIQQSDLVQNYKSLFKTHFSTVKFFIFMLLKSEEDTEYLAQNVFAKLWIKTDIWKDNVDIESYIYKIAKHTAVSYIRHKRLEENY